MYAGQKPVFKSVETGELSTNFSGTNLTLAAGNNPDMTLLAGYSVYKVTLGAANCVLTGMVADIRNGVAIDGQIKTLVNIHATNSFTITNQDANSIVANRFTTGQGTTLNVGPGESINFLYNSTLGWQVSGGSASEAYASAVAIAMAIVFG